MCDWRSHNARGSALRRSGSNGFIQGAKVGGRRAEKLVVDALDLSADLPPVEIRQNGGPSIARE